MHEASIVQSVLRMAAARVPEGTCLRRVRVRIGSLTGISPDSMQFYFDAMRPGRAELEVIVEPLHATCPGCQARSMLHEMVAVCPACSAPGLTYENGFELDLVAIEVGDALDDPDRREDPRQER